MEGYESAVRRHLAPRWAGVHLEDITPDAIQEWVDSFELPGAAEKAYKSPSSSARRLGSRKTAHFPMASQ